LNPLLDVPFFWLAQNFPARVVGFILGTVHGMNLVLVFLIFWEITRISNPWGKLGAGIFLILISGFAPGFISELGITMNDNLISLFVLSGVLLLLKAGKEIRLNRFRSAVFLILVAGIIMGAGTGLKGTMAYCAVASAFSFIAFETTWRNKLIYFLLYGLAGVVGALIGTGYWSWILWSRFGNPLFPFFNGLFASPYMPPADYARIFAYVYSYLPDNLLEYLTWPLIISYDSHRVSELPFSDLRFALIYLLAISWLVLATVKKFRTTGDETAPQQHTPLFIPGSSNFLLLFLLFGFVLWMAMHSLYRYLIPLELLIPLGLALLTERLTNSARLRLAILAGATLAILVFFKPYSWGRVPWSDRYLEVETAQFAESAPQGALVIMLGSSPNSYVIPEFPENFRFVRPEGNLLLDENDLFFQQIKSLLAEYKGPIYVLYSKIETNIKVEQSLERLGLPNQVNQCSELQLNVPWQLLEMCSLSQPAPVP
jgi:hypothetical protein